VTSRAHGLLVDERRDILRTVAIRKGPMRCHTGPEKQRGSSALRAYASLRKHTRAAQTLGSNVLYQCNRDAVRDSRGNRGFRGLTIKTSTQGYD
jgi:hypothetical protein